MLSKEVEEKGIKVGMHFRLREINVQRCNILVRLSFQFRVECNKYDSDKKSFFLNFHNKNWIAHNKNWLDSTSGSLGSSRHGMLSVAF